MSLIGKRGVHPIQVGKWRKELLSRAYELFADRRFKKSSPDESTIKELYEQIGRLKVENDFLKKLRTLSNREKKALIEENHPFLSVAQHPSFFMTLSFGIGILNDWLSFCNIKFL